MSGAMSSLNIWGSCMEQATLSLPHMCISVYIEFYIIHLYIYNIYTIHGQ